MKCFLSIPFITHTQSNAEKFDKLSFYYWDMRIIEKQNEWLLINNFNISTLTYTIRLIKKHNFI